MPSEKSATEKRSLRNRAIRSRIRTTVAQALFALQGDDLAQVNAAVLRAVKLLDKAYSQGVLPRNTAARHKSRLMAKLNLRVGEAQESASQG